MARAPRRLDHVAPGQAALGVEERRPADLGVAHVVARLVLGEVGRRPFERLGVLHQGDRQVEGEQKLGLVGDLVRAHEHGSHPLEGRRRLDAPRPGEVEGRVDAQGAVEVEVQLRLGHRARERTQAPGIESGHDAHARPRTTHGGERHGDRPPTTAARCRTRYAPHP
jgi:hypothetical protein